MQNNKRLWNEKTSVHLKADDFYNVEGFKKGRSSLLPLEVKELGSVKGKTMLHLQCHFGLDTISWARKGAIPTGVDFSGKAIAAAASLSRELKIPVRFLCSDIYDLPKKLKGRFDIVFTSYGVLCWLPDLKKWAKVIAYFLKPGGMFYIAEGHPFNYVFSNERDDKKLMVKYSYFHSERPTKWESEGSYADKTAVIANPSYEWTHSLGDIINALIGAGLQIEFLHEHPYGCYDHYPFMEKGKDGWWRLTGGKITIPLTFSLRAIKPGMNCPGRKVYHARDTLHDNQQAFQQEKSNRPEEH
ncbi:MAG: class I SAM-dependent methyltransferase [Candidatus Edwardsbacteria bacterium]|nr:class I SAM-dependent methyltransferase [Candidatus Edwardsbacteria bacterium]